MSYNLQLFLPPSGPMFFMSVLWLHREGLVSREEITAYFMRASVICSKLGLGFVHNFQETTYMKPTFCDNCSGFVSSHAEVKKMSYDETSHLVAG